MRVKGNQPRLRDALVALCAEREPSDRHETADRGRHGRQEHRRVEVFEVEGRLDPDWRPWIACAARVTRLTWRKDTRTGLWARAEEVAYYVSQVGLTAEGFGRAVRAHWGIENRAPRARPHPGRGRQPDPAPARHLRPPALVRAQHPARPRRLSGCETSLARSITSIALGRAHGSDGGR